MPLVSVTMARGRTPEAKSAMLHAIADAIHDSIGAPRDTIRVWVNEIENTDLRIHLPHRPTASLQQPDESSWLYSSDRTFGEQLHQYRSHREGT